MPTLVTLLFWLRARATPRRGRNLGHHVPDVSRRPRRGGCGPCSGGTRPLDPLWQGLDWGQPVGILALAVVTTWLRPHGPPRLVRLCAGLCVYRAAVRGDSRGTRSRVVGEGWWWRLRRRSPAGCCRFCSRESGRGSGTSARPTRRGMSTGTEHSRDCLESEPGAAWCCSRSRRACWRTFGTAG